MHGKLPPHETRPWTLPDSVTRMLPGVATLAACIVVWQAISLLFSAGVLSGTGGLVVERIVTLYSEPGTIM